MVRSPGRPARKKKPVIALNCDYEQGTERKHPFLSLAYLEAVERAGGIPFLVGPLADPAGADAIAARADGILFTGSDDIDPAFYGKRREPACGRIVPHAKTETDLVLFAAARRRGLPVFGICGGFQVVNIALGGTLLQDIPTRVPGALQHKLPFVKMPGRGIPVHPVDVVAGTRLARLVGAGRRVVNSSHHQAIDRLGRGLRISALSPDGVVEAVETRAGPYLLAVEWHPERLSAGHRMRDALFADFVRAARKGPAIRPVPAAARRA